MEHGLAQLLKQVQVLVPLDTFHNPIKEFRAPSGADPARGALAAGLNRTELHRVASHAGHVDGVIEHDDPAMAEKRTDG